jgi:acyl-CoA ligase (AMP-forming) (exosortase A-associated)
MTELLHQLILNSADHAPDNKALAHKNRTLSYQQLAVEIHRIASALIETGVAKQERVAIYLPKQFETVLSFFGAALAGVVFVPVNPVLKAPQVGHILRDCNVRLLITSSSRLAGLASELDGCPDLHTILLANKPMASDAAPGNQQICYWDDLIGNAAKQNFHRVISSDIASIFYTSGSTGKPKGVVLSHGNMTTGAKSVAEYLKNTPSDRIISVLPFSFDYGFSQLSTAFRAGACNVLMEYLLPRDIIKTIAGEKITGLAAVPPLWVQLVELEWPAEAVNSLRYITNSGGAMPGSTLKKLRDSLPTTDVYLMYGLTEAFRSTYLPPDKIDDKPGSMGKAIPNADIQIVDENGSLCKGGETGELVHRGPLVSLGYWNDKEKTAERFKPAPNQFPELVMPEIAVWSGDYVKIDDEGFLYFIGRKDDMIKSSGYRISPSEIEEVAYASGLVAEASAIGATHVTLGQAVVLVVKPNGSDFSENRLLDIYKKELPAFMVPKSIIVRDSLPRNPNGKIDRKSLAAEYKDLFNGNAG